MAFGEESSQSPTSPLHTHKFTPGQRTSLNTYQVISPGRKAGDQLDDYIRSRTPTPPHSPKEAGQSPPFETLQQGVRFETDSGDFKAFLRRSQDLESVPNRRLSSEQSSLSILGQRSVDSLLTEDSNASHMSGASVKPGSLNEPGGMSLDQFRAQATDWEKNFTGHTATDGDYKGTSGLVADTEDGADFAMHGARPAVPSGGSGVGIGRLMTTDSLTPASNTASPRSSLDRIAEHPGHNVSGGTSSPLFGPPSSSGHAPVDSTDQRFVPESSEEAPPETTLDMLKGALGFEGGKSEATSAYEERSGGFGLGKREAASELSRLGMSHEKSNDAVTGDEYEEKMLPPLTPSEQRHADWEEREVASPLEPPPAPKALEVIAAIPVTSKPFISTTPNSVLDREVVDQGTKTVYSDDQNKIWDAVEKTAVGGAGLGAAVGAVAAVTGIAAPAVAAVAAGVGAGTFVGAGAAAAFGATEEVPKEPSYQPRKIPGSELLQDLDGPKTKTVYSDEQSDIWSAVGKAAVEGVGVGAALGGVATAAVAAPAVAAIAAGVGAGGLVGAGAAAAFGATKEVPENDVTYEATSRDFDGVGASTIQSDVPYGTANSQLGTQNFLQKQGADAPYDTANSRTGTQNVSQKEYEAANKVASVLAANVADKTSDPSKKKHFDDVAMQAVAVSGWAKSRPEQNESKTDETSRANENARARAAQRATGKAPGEPMSVTIQKMLKRPEGGLFLLFAMMIAPYWLAAHVGLGAIGFFWQLVFGTITGIAAMLLFDQLTAYRSRRRLKRAMDVAVLGIMDLNDLRLLMDDHVPTHISFPKFEKVHWLNRSIDKMWPFINKAASKMLTETLTPILEMYKPAVLENMKIKKLTLGNDAPEITGVRIRKSEKPGEVVLDVKLDWRRGKPNFYLDVNPYLTPPITAKVKDVDVIGWMRVTFAPLTGKDFPCFGAIVLSLQEEPMIDFTVGIEGASIAVLPGVDSMIDNTIKTAVVDMLLWPSRMVFPILDGDYKDLEFLPTGVLTVTIIEATGVMKTDIIGKSDPFVFVYVRKLKERIKRTTTKQNNLEPVWNETFEVLVEAPDIQELTLRMMDEETMASAEFIGMAKVPLRHLKPGQVEDRWEDLVPESIIDQRRAGEKHEHERVRGRLHFKMKWDPYVKGQEPWRKVDFQKQQEEKRKKMEEEEKSQMKSKKKHGKK